ncbi:MAG: hypothetical protein ACT4O1_12515 [Gemmatimonadota bacterium]
MFNARAREFVLVQSEYYVSQGANVVGEIFDAVYPGAPLGDPLRGVQTCWSRSSRKDCV